MAKYSYITDKTHNNRKIQVESAKRDGSGKNIENNYAKQNGNYQSLTAGLSNNFDTKKVMVDESAYNFRPTATMGSVELEVGSPCKVKKIIGGSVAFNQLIQNGNFVDTSNWDIIGGGMQGGSMTASGNILTWVKGTGGTGIIQGNSNKISGHKYLVFASVKPSAQTRTGILMTGGTEDGYSFYLSIDANVWTNLIGIINATATATGSFYVYGDTANAQQQGFTCQFKNVGKIDLTQMFGSTIADYIYSLEQANAGSGVAWFKRYFPKEYYAYNSGELVSVKTQGKKITHFNQWDEVCTQNSINSQTGEPTYSTTRCLTDFVRVMPSTEYCTYVSKATQQIYEIHQFDANKNHLSVVRYPSAYRFNIITEPNCAYMRVLLRYNDNSVTIPSDWVDSLCINFHYDGERDGEYEPYNSETYPCDDVDLRGIPQLDENNNLAFEGDEYLADGNVTRKYGIVDLGTLEWTYNSDNGFWLSSQISDIKDRGNAICSQYLATKLVPTSMTSGQATTYYSWWGGTKRIIVNNGSSTTEPSGYMVYELETPTDENSIPFTEVQECDNWGTEEWLAPTTDTRPCEVPVGHETDYLPDLKAKLEVAPTTPNENGVYVMEHNASGNSYTPLATWLQANGYVNEISANAIKENIGGALRHQLAQANNIDFDNTAWVDLGALGYLYYDGFFESTEVANIKPGSYTSTINIMSALYLAKEPNVGWADMVDMTIGQNGTMLRIKNTSYADATAFKNAMKGVLLAYEKASQ